MPVYFQTFCCFTTLLLGKILRLISGSQSPMLLRKHAVQDPDIADKNQYITNWVRQGINCTTEVRQLLIPLGTNFVSIPDHNG